MSSYADTIDAIYAAEENVRGGTKYWTEMGEPSGAGQAWCCVGACWALRKAGHDIGLWTSCSERKDLRGIQYAFACDPHFSKVKLANAKRGDFAIMNFRTDGKLEYSHICLIIGDKDSQGRIKTRNFNVSGGNGVRWYPPNPFQVVWHPDYDDAKNGWMQENGKWYHYTNGKLDRNGWFKGSDGKWYFCGSGGTPVTDEWHQGNGKWYWCGPKGYPVTDEWVVYKNQTYYCGSDGVPVKGWKKIGGKWYHFDEDCCRESETLAEHNGSWYWLGEDGTVVVDQDVTLVFRAGSDGKLTY